MAAAGGEGVEYKYAGYIFALSNGFCVRACGDLETLSDKRRERYQEGKRFLYFEIELMWCSKIE